MLQRIAPAVLIAQTVARQHVGTHLALVGRFEVTKLAAQLDAPFGHDGRLQGGVAVGRDVPVVGLGVFESVDAVQPQGGRQQPGLALVRQRKTDVRNGQQRDALEFQHGIVGRAHFFGLVDVDAVSAQHPVGPPALPLLARAGGVGGAVHIGAVAVDEIHTHRLTMGAVAQELVPRIGEKALEGIHAQLQRCAFVHVARAVDTHRPGGANGVVGDGVFHALCADHGVAPAQHGVAFDLGADVGLTRNAVARHKHRQLRARRFRNGLAQHRAGPQRGGRIPGAGLRRSRHGQTAQHARHQCGDRRARVDWYRP